MRLNIKNSEIQVHIGILVLLLWQVFFQVNYYPVKGDITTINESTVQLLNLAGQEGYGNFLRTLFLDRYDKGTSTLLFQLPWLSLGISIEMVNELLVFFFFSLFFISTYKCFRYFAGPWASFGGVIALLSHELFFKNLNEYETFLIFFGSFTALLWQAGRRFVDKDTSLINALLISAFIFFSVSVRPFESFCIMLGVIALKPRLLLEKPILLGLIAGALWWLIDMESVSRYWSGTAQLVAVERYKWSPKRFVDIITLATILLGLFTMGRKNRRLTKVNLITKMGLLAAFINFAVLFALTYIEDDYLMTPFFLLLLVVIKEIIGYEKKMKLKCRSLVLSALGMLFIVDQTWAIVAGDIEGLGPLKIGRRIGRVDLAGAPVWQGIKGSFDKEHKYIVIMPHPKSLNDEKDVRPLWSYLQTEALNGKLSIEFMNPIDLQGQPSATIESLCHSKVTHGLLVNPGEKESPNHTYFYRGQEMPADFFESKGVEKQGEYSVPAVPPEGMRALHITFYKISCS